MGEVATFKGSGAQVLADAYTQEFQDAAKKRLPITLSNEEYTTRLAALIVAFNRLLAEYVATSVHVNQCNDADARELIDLTGAQFCRNYVHAIAIIHGEGSTVQ